MFDQFRYSVSSVSPIKLCDGSSSLHYSLHSIAHYQVKELEPFLNKKHPLRALKRKTQRSNSPPVTVRNKLIPNVYPMLSTYSRTHLDISEGSVEKSDLQARLILQWRQWQSISAQKNPGPRLVNSESHTKKVC